MKSYRLEVRHPGYQGRPPTRATAWRLEANLVVTAFHAVRKMDEEPPAWAHQGAPEGGVSYRLTFPDRDAVELRPACYDAAADVALLTCEPFDGFDPPVLAASIPGAASWQVDGYPGLAGGEPFTLSGKVVRVRRDRLQLLVDQQTDVDWGGVSGSPILLGNRVAGLFSAVTTGTSTAWGPAAPAIDRLLAIWRIGRKAARQRPGFSWSGSREELLAHLGALAEADPSLADLKEKLQELVRATERPPFADALLDELDGYGVRPGGAVAGASRFDPWHQFAEHLSQHHPEERFVGRAAELRALDDGVESGEGGYFFVTGSAGLGKTALLAEWLRCLRRRGERVVFHLLTRRPTRDADKPFTEAVCFRSLASQLMAVHRLEGPLPAEPERLRQLYRRLLTLPLPAEERLVLVLDALDEALEDWTPGRGLFPPLAPRVCSVFSARPVGDRDWLRDLGLELLPERILRLDRLSRQEIGEFLERSGLIAAADLPRAVAAVWEATEGDPDYVTDLLARLEDGKGDLALLARLPASHSAYLRAWWDEAYVKAGDAEAFEDLMGTLSLLREPLTADALAAVSSADALRRASLGALLESTRRYVEGDRERGYQLVRTRILELVHDRLEADQMTIFRNRLAERVERWDEPGLSDELRAYALRNGAVHLADLGAGAASRLERWLTPPLQVARVGEGGPLGLAEDLRRAVEAARAEASLLHALRFGWQLQAWRDSIAMRVAPPLAPIYVKLGEPEIALEMMRELEPQTETYWSEATGARQRVATALAECGQLAAALEICDALGEREAPLARAQMAEALVASQPDPALLALGGVDASFVSAGLCAGLARHTAHVETALALAEGRGEHLWAAVVALAEHDPSQARELMERLEADFPGFADDTSGYKVWRGRDSALARVARRLAGAEPERAWKLITEEIRTDHDRQVALVLGAGPLAATDPGRASLAVEHLRPSSTLLWLALAHVAGCGNEELAVAIERPRDSDGTYEVAQPQALEVLTCLDLPALAGIRGAVEPLRNGLELLWQSLDTRLIEKRVEYPFRVARILGRALALVDREAALRFARWAGEKWTEHGAAAEGVVAGLAESSVDSVFRLLEQHPGMKQHAVYEAAVKVLARRSPEEAIRLVESVEPAFFATRAALAGKVVDHLGPERIDLLRRLIATISPYEQSASFQEARADVLQVIACHLADQGESWLDRALELVADLPNADEAMRRVRIRAWRQARPQEAFEEAMAFAEPLKRAHHLLDVAEATSGDLRTAALRGASDAAQEVGAFSIGPPHLRYHEDEVQRRLTDARLHDAEVDGSLRTLMSPPRPGSGGHDEAKAPLLGEYLRAMSREISESADWDPLQARRFRSALIDLTTLDPERALEFWRQHFPDNLPGELREEALHTILARLTDIDLGRALALVEEEREPKLHYDVRPDRYAAIARHLAARSLVQALDLVGRIAWSTLQGPTVAAIFERRLEASPHLEPEDLEAAIRTADLLEEEDGRQKAFEALLDPRWEVTAWPSPLIVVIATRLALGHRSTFFHLLGSLAVLVLRVEPASAERLAETVSDLETFYRLLHAPSARA